MEPVCVNTCCVLHFMSKKGAYCDFTFKFPRGASQKVFPQVQSSSNGLRSDMVSLLVNFFKIHF